MTNPTHLKYHEAHTWITAQADGNGLYTVGITGHAQEQLGDVVYVQPPEIGSTIKQGEACGVIESVKTAADVHAPASGVVTNGPASAIVIVRASLSTATRILRSGSAP